MELPFRLKKPTQVKLWTNKYTGKYVETLYYFGWPDSLDFDEMGAERMSILDGMIY